MTATTTAVAAKKGVSPWADAWRRLRKNKAAMAGLVVVILMAMACVFGPIWLHARTGLEASYPFTWLGPRSPGFTHPDVLQTSELVVGRPPLVREAYRGAGQIDFVVRQGAHESYRVQVTRAGAVQRISRVVGAVPVDRLEVKAPAFLVEEANGAPKGAELTDVVLTPGQPLPYLLKRDTPLNVRVYAAAETRVEIVAVLSRGVVASISSNGQPIARADIEGREVLQVAADGVPRTVTHWAGTDILGRDLLSRILVGGRISLLVGLVATLVSLCIGVVYGAVSGYAGGRVDALMMGIVDVLYGVPYMFLVILLLTYFDRSILMLFVALGCVQWLTMGRIVRGQILSLKQKEFVEAARMSGTGPGGIVFGHLIPNTLGVVVVYTTLTVPAVILQESFLSFIGLSVTFSGQDWESWGALVSAGVTALGSQGNNSWLLIFPSLAMAVTLFSLNFLGDGLRDALDPRQRGRQ